MQSHYQLAWMDAFGDNMKVKAEFDKLSELVRSRREK